MMFGELNGVLGGPKLSKEVHDFHAMIHTSSFGKGQITVSEPLGEAMTSLTFP